MDFDAFIIANQENAYILGFKRNKKIKVSQKEIWESCLFLSHSYPWELVSTL